MISNIKKENNLKEIIQFYIFHKQQQLRNKLLVHLIMKF